jgi:ABC-2 type transport system permease protein
MGEKWGNFASAFIYTLTFLIFIQILYSNTKTIATYSKNEMIFFALVGQMSFFTMSAFTWENMYNLVIDVNRGNLDFVLVRPIPGLFYVSLKKISLLNTLRDAIPSIFIMFLIQWSALHLTFLSILYGSIIFICGQIIFSAFFFLFTLPAFWTGVANELLGIGFEFSDQKIPFEGLSLPLKVIFTTIIPTFFTGTVATSVMLHKSNGLIWTGVAVIIAVISMIIKVKLWNLALRNYTSASS